MKKYVTVRLLGRIKRAMAKEGGIDADYFLSAQDWDKDWELDKNIVTATPVISGETATVRLTLNGKEMNNKLKIALRKEAGSWKIDKVNDYNL